MIFTGVVESLPLVVKSCVLAGGIPWFTVLVPNKNGFYTASVFTNSLSNGTNMCRRESHDVHGAAAFVRPLAGDTRVPPREHQNHLAFHLWSPRAPSVGAWHASCSFETRPTPNTKWISSVVTKGTNERNARQECRDAAKVSQYSCKMSISFVDSPSQEPFIKQYKYV